MTHAQAIHLYQPTLQAIAYKMLGCMADAEDVVQETFVKWLSIDTSKIENTKAYLVRMVTNTCLNVIQSKKEKKAISVEVLEDLIDVDKERDVHHFDLENQLGEAWKYLHRKLEPVEKAVFVLREVFNVEYQDIQLIVGRKAENCRKIVSRAKEKLKNADAPKIKFNLPEVHLLDSFKDAYQKGNLTQLIQDFSLDLFKKKR